jgi:hypothetical protein
VIGNGVMLDSRPPRETPISIGAVIDYSAARPHVAVIKCQACDSLFVISKEYGHYGDWEPVWPLQISPVPPDIPEPVRSALAEALLCLAVRAFGGCLLMCRTVIIRLQREQKVKSLQDLKDKGSISQQLYGQADEVRLWANMVGHEDYPADAVDSETCQELVGYVRSLLEAVYVQSARQAKLRERRQEAESQRSEN